MDLGTGSKYDWKEDRVAGIYEGGLRVLGIAYGIHLSAVGLLQEILLPFRFPIKSIFWSHIVLEVNNSGLAPLGKPLFSQLQPTSTTIVKNGAVVKNSELMYVKHSELEMCIL